MPNQEKILTDFAWSTLLEKLKAPKPECALVLGEGAFLSPDGTPLRDALRTHFLKTHFKNIVSTNPQDEFMPLPETERTDFCSAMRLFYQNHAADTALNSLAQMPFPLVLNMTAHHQFAKAFVGTGVQPQQIFYNRSEATTTKIQPPNAHNPLIYNFIGSIEEDNSLVLNHSNLFDYFDAIFGKHQLPEELRTLLRGVKYYVFLGVPFDKWYFHMFLRILGIHNFTTANRHAPADGVSGETMDFVGDLFQIRFVKKNINEFISDLYNHCDAAGILRNDKDGAKSAFDKITEQLESDKLQDAIDLMQTFLKEKNDEELLNDLSQMSGVYRRNVRKRDGKLMSETDFEVEFQRSKRAFKTLLTDIREFHPEK